MTRFKDAETPLAFCRINFDKAIDDFAEAGNLEQFEQMVDLVSGDPNYETVPIRDEEEQVVSKGKSPRKTPKKSNRTKYLAGPANPR